MAGKRRTYKCWADGCKGVLPGRMFMCKHHWEMIPKEIQLWIWISHREKNGKSWSRAARSAIDAVRDLEEIDAQAI